MKKIDYWDLADSERLYYTSVNEAVEEILKKLQEEEKEIPSVLTLTGFTKMKPDVKNEAICVLNNFLESLDWTFSYYDDVATEPTGRMKKAAEKFVKEVLKDYKITTFEQVCIKEVNVKRWIKRHPDWDK
ncbi:hypothetical protein [Treponema putidum]|uniref:hypothetical protein n=1 Tax=Treponema putidum TaxID=221027 RepID=UPI003D8D9A8B